MSTTAHEAVDVEGHPRRWWALAVLCLALGMVALDNSILNVALPHISRTLGANESGLQWITTAYSLVLAGLLLPLAVAGDRWSRKGLLLLGLVVFGVSSLLASQATSTGMLVVARGLMGVGGACAMPATLSLLGNIFPEHERSRAIAIWSGTAGMASAFGPVAGGLLVDHFWWGSVFLVNVPVALLALAAGIVLVPESRDRGTPPIDRRSALAWWAALTALLIAIIEAPQHGFGSPLVVGAGIAAVLLLAAFRFQERRTDGPLVDAATASDPRMLAGGLTMAALFFTMFGGQFVATQWLQGPRGLSAVAAGMCFVPSAAASMGMTVVNTKLVPRWGHGPVSAAGLAVVALGAVGVAVAVAAGNVVAASATFAFLGAGIGLAAPSAAELIMSSAPPARAGSAAGVNETIVEASGALGVALLGSIVVGGHWVRPLPVAAAVCLAAAWGVARTLRRR